VPDGWSHGGSGREKTEAEGADAISDHARISKIYKITGRICQWKITEVKKVVTKGPKNKVGKHITYRLSSHSTPLLSFYLLLPPLFFLLSCLLLS
jgi:hypothetical protein